MIPTINEIKNWFKTDLFPTQAQFWAVFDAYWHKSEMIPLSSIENFQLFLDLKADKANLDALIDTVNTLNLKVNEVGDQLSNKSDKGHTHPIGEIIGLTGKLATIDEQISDHDDSIFDIRSQLENKAEKNHSHEIDDIVGLHDQIETMQTAIGELETSLDGVKLSVIANAQVLATSSFTLSDAFHKVTIFCSRSTGTLNIVVPHDLRPDFVCFIFNDNISLVNIVSDGTAVLVAPQAVVLEQNKRGMVEHILNQGRFLTTGEFS